jgi:hypothetical protein
MKIKRRGIYYLNFTDDTPPEIIKFLAFDDG